MGYRYMRNTQPSPACNRNSDSPKKKKSIFYFQWTNMLQSILPKINKNSKCTSWIQAIVTKSLLYHVAPLAAFRALFSNTKADLSTACSECCRWDLNNTAVGTKKEPLEMARWGILQMGRGRGSKTCTSKSSQHGGNIFAPSLLTLPYRLDAIRTLGQQNKILFFRFNFT